MEWTWMEGSVLYNCSGHTPTKEIFQAVCDELGRYYVEKGKKYARSSHTIKWKGKHLKYEIKFNSSHYNRQGDSVDLEIITNIWALSKEGMERNGILDFETWYGIPPAGSDKVTIVEFGGEIREREPHEGEEPELIYSRNCDIYGIDQDLFEKIVGYIDGVIKKAELFETKEGIDAYLKTIPDFCVKSFWEDANSVQYYNQLGMENTKEAEDHRKSEDN